MLNQNDYGSGWEIGAFVYVEDSGYLSSDLNGDNQVDILDLQCCVNVFLGLETDNKIIQRAEALAAPDNHCDVVDVQTIVNVILGL